MRVRALAARAAAHPIPVIAAVGFVAAVGHQWWVRRNRFLGAIDADESGYLATALRFERAFGDGGPGALWDRVAETISGPLVPLLSAPLAAVGGRDVWAAQAVQPLLLVVCAVAVAAITARLSTPVAGTVTGLMALGVPTAIVSARSYQFNLGAAACFLLAVWALLASDRGSRLAPMVGFGAAAGAMALARTMTIGFLPALALGAVVLVRWDRRGAVGAAAAGATAAAVAAPWWIQGWDGITGYLWRYGSSDFADEWGPDNVVGRLGERAGRLWFDVGPALLVLELVAAAVVAASLVRWRRGGGAWRAWPLIDREVVTVAAVLAASYAALLATSNTGTWFDTPQQLLLLALGGALVARLPRVPGGTVRAPVRLATAGLAVTAIALLLSVPGERGQDQFANPLGLFYSGVDRTQDNLYRGDPRLQDPRVTVRREAATEWYEANLAVAEAMDRADRQEGGTSQVLSGSSDVLNVNTVLLAAELQGLRTGTIEVPITTVGDDELATWAEPTSGGLPRVAVLVHTEATPFLDDRGVDRLEALLRDRGWRPVDGIGLPDGGEVLVLVPPDR